MKSCIKKFVSVSLIILLALGTMLPAAGGAEVVVCSDCFEHMEAGEEHTYESAEPFIKEAATVPEDEGRSVIAPAEGAQPGPQTNLRMIPGMAIRSGPLSQFLPHLDPDRMPLRVCVGIGIKIKANDIKTVFAVKRDRVFIA